MLAAHTWIGDITRETKFFVALVFFFLSTDFAEGIGMMISYSISEVIRMALVF
jgi:hypothetical protein